MCWTADATEGGWLEEIVFKATPAGNTSLTVARIWVNNGGTTGTATNNGLIAEIGLPVVVATATAESIGFIKPIRRAFDPAFRIYITLGTGSANGWNATGFGGKY